MGSRLLKRVTQRSYCPAVCWSSKREKRTTVITRRCKKIAKADLISSSPHFFYSSIASPDNQGEQYSTVDQGLIDLADHDMNLLPSWQSIAYDCPWTRTRWELSRIYMDFCILIWFPYFEASIKDKDWGEKRKGVRTNTTVVSLTSTLILASTSTTTGDQKRGS